VREGLSSLSGLSGFSGSFPLFLTQVDKPDKPDKPNKRDKPNKPNRPETMKITRFEDLECWQEARQLTKQVYDAVRQDSCWQKDLRLCGQVQNAAASVMANIAEGFTRRSSSSSSLYRPPPRSKAIYTLPQIKATFLRIRLTLSIGRQRRRIA
jgi:23S rRNA-intervening sequence protein